MLKLVFLAVVAVVVAEAQFFGRPSGNFFRQPAPRPQTFFRPGPPRFQSRPPPQTFSRPSVRGPPGPPSRPSGGRGNYQWRGGDYYLSWRDGKSSLTWSAAQAECAGRGMRMISLDDPGKSRHFLGLTGSERQEYFWAGGRISSDAGTLFWENGRSDRIFPGTGDWSDTPRSLSGRPQPETGGECLAILNNVYGDGIRWHDVACHHRKPTICEA